LYIELELPDLQGFPDGFRDYWLNITFTNNPPIAYHIRGIVTNYVRLVEAAMADYRHARLLTHSGWTLTTAWGRDHNRACGYFEACLSNMHRAIRFMKRILNHPEIPQTLKNLFSNKPLFTRTSVADRICNIRNAIHHLDEKILKGIIPKDTPFTLMATGLEVPVPLEPGQTLKTIDRLRIGHHEILFSEMCAWLLEMACCAEQISIYEGHGHANSSTV